MRTQVRPIEYSTKTSRGPDIRTLYDFQCFTKCDVNIEEQQSNSATCPPYPLIAELSVSLFGTINSSEEEKISCLDKTVFFKKNIGMHGKYAFGNNSIIGANSKA